MASTSKSNTFLNQITQWLNLTFPQKSVTVELLKEFSEKPTHRILPKTNIKTFEDVVQLIEKNDCFDILPFILEQNATFVQALNTDNKLRLIKQLMKKSLYGFDIFYCIIRWGDVELLNLLITEYKLDDYDSNENSSKELDTLLSNSLHLLMIRSVDVCNEIRHRCEEILLEIRFINKNSIDKNKHKNKNNTKITMITLEERINFLIELIDDFDYNNHSVYMLKIKSIAENMFLLMKEKKINKHQSVYLNQMQFLLALYVNKITGKYNLSLSFNIKTINNYLKLFKKMLSNFETNKDLASILTNDENKLLAMFSKEVQINRSLMALTRIAHYMEVIDTQEENEVVMRYAIERCLQITGENLKSSDMSPNISAEVEKVFEESAPLFLKHIRKMRDALSHVEYLRSRLKILDKDYFKLKTELKSIYPKILNIIYMQRFIQFEKQSEISLYASGDNSASVLYSSNIIDDANKILRIKNRFSEQYLDDYLNLELVQVCSDELESNQLWYHFCKNIKTSNEKELLKLLITVIDSIHKINHIENIFVLNSPETGNKLTILFKILIENNGFNLHDFDKKLKKNNVEENDVETDVKRVIIEICKRSHLNEAIFHNCLNLRDSLNNLIKSIDNEANDVEVKFDIIKNNTLIDFFHQDIDDWKDFSKKIKFLMFDNFCLNIKKLAFEDSFDDVVKLFNKFFIHLYGKKPLRDSKLIIANWLIPKTDDLIEPVCNRLKYLININPKGSMYQAALEMCVLDILEINKANQSHDSNAPFNETYPILLGKELRNELAHHNSLCNCFPNDHSVKFSAKKLINLIKEENWKMGVIKPTSIQKLKNLYLESKKSILDQSKIFKAAETDTLVKFKATLILGDVASNQNNLSVAKCATIGNNLEVFQYLINTTKLDFNLKSLAIKHKSDKILTFLMKLNKVEGNELHQAILYDQYNIASTLIDKSSILLNSKSFYYNLTPLHLSCLLKKYQMAKLLINSGADIESRDSKNNAPIHIAALMGNLKILNLLLKNKAKINSLGLNDKTALHLAVGNGHEDLVNRLLYSKQKSIFSFLFCSTEITVDVNCQDINKQTALHLAVRSGCHNIITLLLEHNANIDSKDKDDNTPIHLAAIYKKDILIFKMLIDSNAILDGSNKNGDTLLHLVNDFEIAKLLPVTKLMDSKNKYNQTPLHSAVIKNNDAIIRLLIKSGANIYIIDSHNRYAWYYDDHNLINVSIDYINLREREKAQRILSYKYDENLDVNNMNSNNIKNSLHSNFENIEKTLAKINISFTSLTINEKLLCAAYNGKIDQIEKLISSSGADLNTKFENKFNLLDVAAYNTNLHLFKKNWIQQLSGVRALHISASINYLKGIELLVNNGVNVNGTYDEFNETPLHAASMRGHVEAMEILIQMGADVNAVNKYDGTSLHIAVRWGRLPIIKFLLEKGANINVVTKGSSPLHVAVLQNNEEIAKLLLDKEANIDAVDGFDETPLLVALLHHNKQIASLLLEKGANINAVTKDGNLPIHEAVLKGYTNITKRILEKGADINAVTKNGNSALHIAILKGYTQITKLLLENGANINSIDNVSRTPLHKAAFKGSKSAVMLLLENGADINATDSYKLKPIHMSTHNKVSVMKELLQKGADINDKDIDGNTVFHITSQYRSGKILRILLGVKVNKNKNISQQHEIVSDSDSDEMLCSSENNTKFEIKQLLKVNINDKNNAGRTAFHFACLYGNPNLLEIFLNVNEVDTTVVDYNGWTGLHFAIFNDTCYWYPNTFAKNEVIKKSIDVLNDIYDTKENNNDRLLKSFDVLLYIKDPNDICSNLVKQVINNGANVNAIDQSGFSALHYAVMRGRTDCIEILLNYGANINLVANNGQTPISLAYIAKTRIEIVMLSIKNIKPHYNCEELLKKINNIIMTLNNVSDNVKTNLLLN